MSGALQGAWEAAERGISLPVSCPAVEMGKEVSIGPLDPQLPPCLRSVVDLRSLHSTLSSPFTRGPRGPPTAPECRAPCWGRSQLLLLTTNGLVSGLMFPWDGHQ